MQSNINGQRYTPIRKRGSPTGIVILQDHDPAAPESISKGKSVTF